jgi:unsaturated rhamnogalacturonyl hydrolase
MTAARQQVHTAVGLGDDAWSAGKSPAELARRVTRNYLGRPLSLTTPMHYAEACTWYGALTVARLAGDGAARAALEARFAPLASGAAAAAIPARPHVDDRVFGIVPLAIPRYAPLGRELADAQWRSTTADGITTEARYWVDDMYMITALQVQAYRATGDATYLDRAARTMAAYLDRLQQPNGLFFHTMTSPLHWGRGNGWVAAGMTELLRALPAGHAARGRVLAGFTRMMAALRAYQAPGGTWNQLIDDASAANWAELSATGMFTFAMVTGVRRGWLPAETYAPVARAAWLALCERVDADGNVADVCPGTGEAATSGAGAERAAQVRYYLDRPRIAGDFHGQAPLLWSAAALMDRESPHKGSPS